MVNTNCLQALRSSLHLNISPPEAVCDTNAACVMLVFRGNPQGANNEFISQRGMVEDEI